MALLAHLGLHGDRPIDGVLADLVLLLGPVVLLAAVWALLRRAA
jgi:hypothetical protein